ncbi:MAG: ATP-binding protein [Anaerolineae bacterium]
MKFYHNVILMGAVGSGKSCIACALGIEACKQSYSVRFIRGSIQYLPDFLYSHDYLLLV